MAMALTGEQLSAAASVRVFFGHKSVGSNILGGLAELYRSAGVEPPQIVETRDVAHLSGWFLAHSMVGANRDPLGKLKEFADIVGGPLGGAVDVAALKFCYADVTSDTDIEALFGRYVEVMDELAGRRPDLRLLYTTVPLTTDRAWKAKLKALAGRDDRKGPADNLARYRYNTMVRDRYASTGRLFDVAAVEATLTGEPMTRTLGGQTYHVLNSSLAADAGHLNPAGAKAAATEFARVVALSRPPA